MPLEKPSYGLDSEVDDLIKRRGEKAVREALKRREAPTVLSWWSKWKRFFPAVIVVGSIYTVKQGVDSVWNAAEQHLSEEVSDVSEEAAKVPQDLAEVHAALNEFIVILKDIKLVEPLVDAVTNLWTAIKADWQEAQEGKDYHLDQIGAAFWKSHEPFFNKNPELKAPFQKIMDKLEQVKERGVKIAGEAADVATITHEEVGKIMGDAFWKFPQEMVGMDTSLNAKNQE